jgi:hypothetical protein
MWTGPATEGRPLGPASDDSIQYFLLRTEKLSDPYTALAYAAHMRASLQPLEDRLQRSPWLILCN